MSTDEKPLTKYLSYYKVDKSVRDPIIKTVGSACFDIPISLRPGFDLKVWKTNCNYELFEDIINLNDYETRERKMSQRERANVVQDGLIIKPNVTYLVPTGLIFEIPFGYHLQIHLRSSTGLKKHLGIPSHIGIIDSDYRDEVHVPLYSLSDAEILVKDGDMIAQAMLVKNQDFNLLNITSKPDKLESRSGGFGSTGN